MDTIMLGILVVLLMIPGQSSADHELERRLCGDDFTTVGRCFLAVPLSLEWTEAGLYCYQNLTGSPGGKLAELNEQLSQDLVAGLASSIGSPDVWINYKRNTPRRWRWLAHYEDNGFQGCWVEDTFNPELPTLLSANGTTKPSDCLVQCENLYNYFLSVQTDDSGNLVCRCGDDFGQRGHSYSSQCDAPCPISSTEVINRNCAAPGHQLIYQTSGQTYHNFAPANNRQYEHCVVFDHRFGHKWAEHSCMDELPFVCQHYDEEQYCLTRSSYLWRHGVCFTIQTEPKNFYEAQEVCHKFDGLLLKPSSADANDAIVSLLDDGKSYFIALTDDEFLTSDWNLMHSMFNWGPNQPNYQSLESCVSMKASDSFWYNINCNTRLPFVCMVDIYPSSDPHSVPVNTTTTAETTTTASGGLSRDLIIGIGAGAGGALLLVILTILCICFIRRSIQQRALSSHKPAGRKSPGGRRPRKTSTVSNPAYQPDVILNHQVPRSGQKRGKYDNPSPIHTHRGSEGYLNLYDGSKSLHTYESIKSGNSSYQNHSRRY